MDLELTQYLEKQIKRYNKFDGGHNELHVREVIDNIILLGNKLNLNLEMCKTIAVYHDLGLEINREEHHIYSGKILRKDISLRKWFSEEEIEIMALACEEHRASYKGVLSSKYSYVISDADRYNSPKRMIERSYRFTRNKFKDKSNKEVFNKVYNHLIDKYGRYSGYGTYKMNESHEVFNSEETWNLLENQDMFLKVYIEVSGEKVNIK